MSLFDSASLVVTPNGVKEDKLYSIKPTNGSGDLVVTRATTATRVNSDGLIEVTPYNLASYSEQFDNAYWVKNSITVTANATTAPNGTLNADRLQFTGAGFLFGTSQIIGTVYTISCWAKRNGTGTQSVGFFKDGSGIVDSAWALTSEWKRFTYTYTASNVSFVGIAGVSGADVFVWGAQLVTGTSAKEYFPTTDRLDVPRLDYTNSSCPSILVEPQRTNLALYSEQFDNAYWLKGNTTVTANQTISPDGTQTADTLLATSGMTSFLYRSFTLTVGTPYTFSIYVKKKTITALGNRFRINFVSNLFVNFNGSVPVITGGSGIIEEAGNEFYRIITTVTPSVTSNILYIYPDGTNNNADEYYIWGAQLEAGSYATSYVPTVASTVTRNADVISKTGISSLINSVEGSFYVEASSFINGGSFRQFSLSNGTDNSRLTIGWSSVASRLLVRLDIGGTNIINTDILSFNQTSNNKVLFKWGGGNFKAFINGVEKLSLTSLSMPTANLFTKLGFDRGSSAGFFEGNVKSVLVFPNVLTDQECINLTTI